MTSPCPARVLLAVLMFAAVSCAGCGPRADKGADDAAGLAVSQETGAEAAGEDAGAGRVDDFFMSGDDEERGSELLIESPEYFAAKKNLFADPASKLGMKPLRLTLEDCIRIALANNNKVQASEYSVEAAKARLSEAQATFWPVFEYEWLSAPVPRNVTHAVDAFFTGDLTWWNKVNFTMGVPIYTFNKIKLAQALAAGGIHAARAERAKEKLSTSTQVRQLYYGILLAEELGHLLVNAHNKLTNEVEKEKDGKSPIDKIKAEVFLVDIERRLADVRDKEFLALEGLRVQLGLNPDVAITVYSDKLRPMRTRLKSMEAYVETALSERPETKLLNAGVDARRKQYMLEKKQYFPDVGLGFYIEAGRTATGVTGLTTTDDFSNPFNFGRAGVGVRIKGRLDLHGQSARVRKAKSEYYKASLEQYTAKDGIALDVKKAYLDAKTSYDNVIRVEKAERYARQLMFLTQSNYELGIGERQEYTDALQLVLFTRGKYFEAVFNYNVALAILDEKAGVTPEFERYQEISNQ